MGGACSTLGEMKNIKFSSENLKGSVHAEDLGTDGTIILEWILRKQCGKVWTGCI